MRDYVSEFPYLNHLVGGYFHQDWMTDGDTWQDVVRFFCRMERAEDCRGVVKDIEELLRISETELQLLEALHAFGCAYRVDGCIREWLSGVAEVVSSSSAVRGQHAQLQ